MTKRTDTLTSSMDNVLAWRLGEAFSATNKESAGDYIDRGLALRHHLEDKGFGLVQLDPKSTLFGGQWDKGPGELARRYLELRVASLDFLRTVQDTLLTKDAVLVRFPLQKIERLLAELHPAIVADLADQLGEGRVQDQS